MTKDKYFYNNFFKLFTALVLQNIIMLSVNLADNIMLGGYSETALSGVSAVNQVQFIFSQIIMGIGDGMVVLASQYYGQKRTEPIKKLSSIAIRFGISVAILLFILVSIFPEETLYIFTEDKNIVNEGTGYLNIIRFTYIIFALTILLLATLRSIEKVKIAFYVSLSTLVINCCINYILIYGHFGMPRMGARGAAIGTLVARIVELIIVLVYITLKDRILKLNIREYIKIDKVLLKDYIKISTPIIIVASLWGCSTAMQTVILGHMNSSAIAANSVASNLFLILKTASIGAAATASIIIGKTVGKGDINKIREYTKTLQVMFIIIGILTSIILFFLRTPILNLYQLTLETKILANSFMLVLCVTCIGTAYQMPVLIGIVRGGGDTRFVMINDLISIWCIVIPLSFFAAFKLHLPPVVVLFCINSDQIFKCIAAAIKVNGYGWVKKLTRE